jgi:hypothetical protein
MRFICNDNSGKFSISTPTAGRHHIGRNSSVPNFPVGGAISATASDRIYILQCVLSLSKILSNVYLHIMHIKHITAEIIRTINRAILCKYAVNSGHAWEIQKWQFNTRALHITECRKERRRNGTRMFPQWSLKINIYRIYRVSQEECARFREGVSYVKIYRYNPNHLCPKLNGYGDNGQRSLKFWQVLRTCWLPNTH